MSKSKFRFAVWSTQHGGLVQRSGLNMVFVKKPNCKGFKVGDMLPKEWDTIPANDAARSFAQSDRYYRESDVLPDFD